MPSHTLIYLLHRLWHQISDNLIAYTKETCFDEGDTNSDLLNLYNELVKGLSTKLNPLKYAQITIKASRQFTDIEQAITFLEEAKARLDMKKDAQFLCRIA